MPASFKKYYICLVAVLMANVFCLGQANNYPRLKLLFNKPFDRENTATEVLWETISKLPLQEVNTLIKAFENDKSVTSNDSGLARLSILKIRSCRKNVGVGKYDNISWVHWGNEALKHASLAENDYLLQSTCHILGDIHLNDGKIDTAVFFMLKSVAMAEALGYTQQSLVTEKIFASNVLYRTRNYQQCLEFCHTPVDVERLPNAMIAVNAYNNSGLAYLKLDKPDSAIYFFSKEVDFCRRIGSGVWIGIASGNIGDALHAKGNTAEAMPYWQIDYDSSMKYQEYKNAALTLAYMSQFRFDDGAKDGVLQQLRWCAAINYYDAANLLRIYKIQAHCFRKLGMNDSADIYLDKHYHLNDSLNKVISQNNFNTVHIKLAFEKNIQDFKLLKKERQAEINRRNFLLAALAALLLIGILLYNRQRLKIKLAKQYQESAEKEMEAAKQQLDIFTQTLLEKNDQIEKLSASLEQQHTINADELIHQTLLTDYDWNRFKELFEKIHPSFFPNLKNAAPGITQSEMRLAALIKLNLDNKQMASMQGISVSSLRGNKTRLRQKLNIAPETELEDLIKQL